MTRRGQVLGATLVFGTLLLLVTSRLLTFAASVGDRIPIEGLDGTNHGLALWNTGPDASEPEMSGHQTPWTSCSTFAPFYLASADFGAPDGITPSGLRSTPTIEGMPAFATALTAHGFVEGDLTMSFGPQTLGADREGHEWAYDPETGVEHRYYAGGEFTLALNGDPLVGGRMPRTSLRIDYNADEDCTDDEVSGATDVARPVDRSGGGSDPVRAVADALLRDLAENGLRVRFESLSPTGDIATVAGRTARVFNLQSGQMEVADACSCALGIFESDDTHRWELRWDGSELPDEDPVRLKVRAISLDGTEGVGSSLVVTAFDESALMNGKELKVDHPLEAGDSVGWLDLDILPNTNYSFTVRHTGPAKHYRLGTSHPELVLGHAGVRFQRGERQSWEIQVAADEVVQLEVSADAENLSEEAVQATSVTLTIDDVDVDIDASTESPTRPLSPGLSQVFSFTNGPTDRTLIVHTEADGHFRLAKVGGDERLYTQPCPLSDAGPAIITITDAGVDSSELHLAVGERVEIVNDSSQPHRIQSNPHPFHTDCPPLNIPGQLEPGERGFTASFDQEGTCGFHDHLNPLTNALQGQIVIGDAAGGPVGVGGDAGDAGGGGMSPYAVPGR